MEYNLADLFESIVDTVPDREALVYVDHPGTGAERRLTYAELDRAANRLAHHLSDHGIGPGRHVGLHLYNGIEYLQAAYACLKIRAVPVNVNYRYVEEELAYLYRDADLAALVFDAEFTARVAAALPGHPGYGISSGSAPRPTAPPSPGSPPSRSRTPRPPALPHAASARAPPTTGSSSTPAAPRVCPRA